MKKINNILAISSILSSLAAYQLWRLLWDDFCYQMLAITIMLLFALVYNIGKNEYWVGKSALTGLGWGLYNLVDETFLNPLHCSINEYISASMVLFFVFLVEIIIFLQEISSIIEVYTYNFILHITIKALVNGPERRTR